MSDPLVFREVEQGFNACGAQPGFYACCHGERLNSGEIRGIFNSGLTAELAESLFAGVLLPYFMHNANNLLVGVMGNIDLASMFMPDMDRVAPKLASARESTELVVDFIRTVTSSVFQCDSSGPGKAVSMLRAASGRSVSSGTLDHLVNEPGLPGGNTRSFMTAFRGAGTWCLLCMGGSGELTGKAGEKSVELEWKRPGNAGKSHMPGLESAGAVLAAAAGVAVSSGYTVHLEKWSDTGGKVTIVFDRGC